MNNEIQRDNKKTTVKANIITVENINDSDIVLDQPTANAITKHIPITHSKDIGVNTNYNHLTNIKIPKPKNNKNWNDTSLFYNFCMIINHIIISTTLLLVTYFLYKLTYQITEIDFDKIISGIDSVDENLNDVSQIGNQITTLMTNFQYSELANFDFNRINLVVEQFYDLGLENINTDDINLLVRSLNQTLVNFNNAINSFRIPMFSPTITPQFDPTFNAEFSTPFDGTDNIDYSAPESTSPSTSPIDPPTSPSNPSTSAPNPSTSAPKPSTSATNPPTPPSSSNNPF